MKFEMIFLKHLLLTTLMVSMSMSYGGSTSSGFSGGSKSSTTSTYKPSTPSVQRAAPTSGLNGGSRSSDVAKPAVPSGVTNQVIMQQAQKQAAVSAWSGRNNVEQTQARTQPSKVATPTEKVEMATKGAIYASRVAQTQVRSPDQSRYVSNNNDQGVRREVVVQQQPQAVMYPHDTYDPQVHVQLRQITQVSPDSSGDSNRRIFWILFLVFIGGVYPFIFWYLNQIQRVANSSPKFIL
jgi:hypothetical protein